MLKETIKFTDFNGVERTEDHAAASASVASFMKS